MRTFQSGACYLDLYAYDEAVQDWRHMGPIGGGFGGDDGGTPFYNLQVLTYDSALLLLVIAMHDVRTFARDL